MAKGARGYLGMTHNPFAQPSEGFFERGDRKAYLEQLRHLSHWTRRVLLVTGPQGAGKSILFRQLSAGLEPRAKAARVNGGLVNTAREMLAAVAQGYGIAAPGNANTQLLAGLIAEHIREQETSDRFCVTMIDDAEALEPRALEVLLKLTLECSMRLVLFGELALVEAVERCARKHELSWHEIRLAGLNGQDARDYLEWRFAEAKYRGRLPFTDQQVAEIVRLAEGFPGRMNLLANVLLAKLESGDVRPDRTRFPAVHRALAGLLALLACLVYLIWLQSREGVQEPGPVGPIAVPQIAPEVDLIAVVDSADLVNADSKLEAPSALPLTPAEQVEPASLPAARGGLDSVAEPLAEPEMPASESAIVPPAGELPAVAALAGLSAGERAETPGEAWHGEDWLLAQAQGAFTIQLVSVSTMERAAAFLAKQSRPEDFAIYRLNRDGRVLHVILFGIFGSREEAQSAAAQLPDSVGDVRPWIRAMAQVHGAIKAAP